MDVWYVAILFLTSIIGGIIFVLPVSLFCKKILRMNEGTLFGISVVCGSVGGYISLRVFGFC